MKHTPPEQESKTENAGNSESKEESQPPRTGDGPDFVVALGASAGGLKTLETFLTHLSPDSKMAFVVIMHLDPEHKTMLPELLGRQTRMPVSLVEEGTELKAGAVYVIPSNRDLTIDGQHLHLEAPEQPRGGRHPIDRFLRSLAEQWQDKAVAVILSGTGSDGTQGVKAVKEQGGLVVAQDVESAEYRGMPQSVQATGLADLILPPDQMPGKILDVTRRNGRLYASLNQSGEPEKSEALQRILKVVTARTRNDFTAYKSSTVIRRIERRMAVTNRHSVNDYLQYLEEHAEEARALFKEILIGVTSFFRDPEAFEALRQEVVPALFADRNPQDPVRVWLPGCATGEEAYSVAILLREYQLENHIECKIQLFATDIDERAVERARRGVYGEGIASDVGPERLRAFFRKIDGAYQVCKALREMIVFAQHNLTQDPPFSRLDLLVCRNLLIYLNPQVQKRLLPLFFHALRQDGFLVLGTSESVGSFTSLFEPLSKKWKIFRRKESGRSAIESLPRMLDFSEGRRAAEQSEDEAAGKTIKPGALAEKILMQRYSPPCVVVNEKAEVVYFSNRTGRYLEPPAGEPTHNVLKLARKELRPALRAAIKQAIAKKEPVIYRNLSFSQEDARERVDLRVEAIHQPAAARGLLLVVFEDSGDGSSTAASKNPPSPSPDQDEASKDQIIEQLEEQLRITHEQLQSTVEELETSNEELKSSNEELMSMNEEFQSTNEELETSKEELQALNEELSTVNSELESKVKELADTNSDLENLLNSGEIATVFLDRQLQVKRFTPAMAEIFHLLANDIGRPLRHVSGKIEYPGLEQDAEAVLKDLKPREREVSTGDGRFFQMKVSPYRTVEDVIDGVVVTLFDITARRQAEARRAQLAAIVSSSHDGIIGIELDGTITSWNPGAERLYGFSESEVVGRKIDMLVPSDRSEEMTQILKNLKAGKKGEKTDTVQLNRNGEAIEVALTVSPVRNDAGEIVSAAVIARDISERKRFEKDLLEAKEKAEAANRLKTEFLSNVSHEVRTPLTGIKSTLELLQDVSQGPERDRLLNLCRKSSDNLLKILEDLLEVSKIEAGVLDIAEQPFNFTQWLEATVFMFAPTAEAKELALELNLDPAVPSQLVGDPHRLRQILSNLINNAVKFTDAGRVDVAVNLHQRDENSVQLAFTVSDTGIGIPAAMQTEIFERFRQVDSSSTRKYGGTGLGLSIAQSLVQHLGGELTVKSRDGEGSVFSFTLPFRLPEADAPEQ